MKYNINKYSYDQMGSFKDLNPVLSQNVIAGILYERVIHKIFKMKSVLLLVL